MLEGDVRMGIPNKHQIVEKAIELWKNDRVRANDPSFDLTPEIEELREGGFLSAAQSALMRNPESKNAEWLDSSKDAETLAFQFDTKEGMTTTTFISGSRGVGKSDVAMKISDQLMKEGILVVVFDCSGDWVKRSGIRRYLKADPLSDLAIQDQNVIVDTSMLTPMQQQNCVEWFCRKLFEYQLNSAKRFYLIFEEAQIFFPLNSLRSLRAQNTMRILTTGRNFGVSLCAISQFAATIDKELVKHAGQIFLGYASEQNTLAYWKGILGKKAEDLKKLQNGQFVYFNRNKISLTEIEPYESDVCKTQIQIPEVQPTQPTNQSISIIPLAKLFILLVFGILVLNSLRGM
jgi:hypothetical protein